MNKISNPEFIVFVKIDEHTVRQVLMNEKQSLLVRDFMGLVFDNNLPLADEKVAEFEVSDSDYELGAEGSD